MFSSADFFESDFAKSHLINGQAPRLCSEHAINPTPIKAHAEQDQPFVILQFRPAFALQLYLRFVRAPYIVKNLEYPSIETAGRLPVLKDGHFILPEEDVLTYFREQYPNLDLDAKLSGGKRAQVGAFMSLVQEKLVPALRASRYRDEKNFVQNVRAVILRATRFPLGQTVSNAERKRGMEEQRFRGLTEGGVGLGEVLARAHAAYRELDNWLGSSTGDFFFGREPTSFDASLFGHLAEAMADINLVVMLTTLPNLMGFFRRIAEDFFSIGATAASNTNTSSSSNSRGGGGGGGGGSGSAVDLIEYYRRADYVNAKNVFNQVEAAKLCAEAPLVPEPMLQKFMEGDGPTGGEKVGREGKGSGDASSKAGGSGGGAAGQQNNKKKENELEEERERHKENVLWLTVVGGVVTFFLLFEGIMALATGEIQIVDEGAEEEEEEESS